MADDAKAEKVGVSGEMNFTGLFSFVKGEQTTSISAMQIEGVGCIVRTVMRNGKSSPSQALVFVPGIRLGVSENGNMILQKLE